MDSRAGLRGGVPRAATAQQTVHTPHVHLPYISLSLYTYARAGTRLLAGPGSAAAGRQGARSVAAAARRGWPAPYANNRPSAAEHSG